MRTYETKQGDMWDSIAYEQMGDVKYANLLMEANPAYHDVFIFSSGSEIVIPDIAVSTATDVPPWKRVSG